jgi:hypothetical protein
MKPEITAESVDKPPVFPPVEKKTASVRSQRNSDKGTRPG